TVYTMKALELKTLDARFRAFHDPAQADTGIVIIDVDNYSLPLLRASLGRPPWPREVGARVARFPAAGPARARVLAFTFPYPARAPGGQDRLRGRVGRRHVRGTPESVRPQ